MSDDNGIDKGNVDESLPPTYSNLPLVLTLVALTIYFGFEMVQGLTERANLSAVKSSQEAAIQEAQRVQAQFKTLVAKTSELADQGHAGAKMVMDQLFKGGTAPASGAAEPNRAEKESPK